MSLTEVEATVAIRTLGPPVGSTIPGRSTASQPGARFVQGQHELSGTRITDPKNTAPKRPYSVTTEGPHSPPSEERPKTLADGEKVRKGG